MLKSGEKTRQKISYQESQTGEKAESDSGWFPLVDDTESVCNKMWKQSIQQGW